MNISLKDFERVKKMDCAPPTTEDMDKVATTLRQIVRDWSEDGRAEREASYQPVMHAVLTRLGYDGFKHLITCFCCCCYSPIATGLTTDWNLVYSERNRDSIKEGMNLPGSSLVQTPPPPPDIS